MKKIYFLATLLGLSVSASAQLEEGFEDYPLGSYFGGNWSTWSGSSGAENLIISNDFAASGSQSGFIGGDGVQDAVLKLGNISGGIWTTQIKVFVEFGLTGYFNFQDNEVPTGADGTWGLQIHINDQTNYPENPDEIVVVAVEAQTGFSAPYTYDQWVTLTFVQDLDQNTAVVYMDGEMIYEGAADLGDSQLGGMDFFSIGANNAMYMDDIVVYEGEMGIQDANIEKIQVYPTVATDFVNVSSKTAITNISVFNTAGQQVLKTSPNAVSTQINTSSLPSGVYIVKIMAGKESLTKKIVVK